MKYNDNIWTQKEEQQFILQDNFLEQKGIKFIAYKFNIPKNKIRFATKAEDRNEATDLLIGSKRMGVRCFDANNKSNNPRNITIRLKGYGSATEINKTNYLDYYAYFWLDMSNKDDFKIVDYIIMDCSDNKLSDIILNPSTEAKFIKIKNKFGYTYFAAIEVYFIKSLLLYYHLPNECLELRHIEGHIPGIISDFVNGF